MHGTIPTFSEFNAMCRKIQEKQACTEFEPIFDLLVAVARWYEAHDPLSDLNFDEDNRIINAWEGLPENLREEIEDFIIENKNDDCC